MRLLKRHTDTADHVHQDEDVVGDRTAVARGRDRDVDGVPDPPPAPDHAGPAVPDGRTMDEPDRPEAARPAPPPVAPPMAPAGPERGPRRPRDIFADDTTARNERVEPATVPVDAVPDRDAVPRRTERVETEDVVIRRWSWADAAVALIGAGLTLVGILALTRTGVNTSWFSPVENVLDASHTQLLGALEAAAGVLLVLAALARSRILATLLGLAMAVGGAFAAIETAEVSRELAIEDWWAWSLVGVGVLVVLLAIVPRRGRVERVVRPG